MKKAIALLMALVCLLTVTAIPVSAKEEDLDSVFNSKLSFLDCYYTLDAEYMAHTVCGELYSWEEGEANDWKPQPMAADEFEKHLDLYFVANATNIAALRAYQIWSVEENGLVPFYDKDTDTYQVFFVGGFGGAMPQREYLGYVATQNGYKAYFQHMTYDLLEGEAAMAEAEKQGWPELFVYGGYTYKNGPDGYYRLVSRDTYGNVYVVQYNKGIVRVLSQKTYTAKDLPASLAPASIIKQPTTDYAKIGEKASVSVKATGLGLTYTWYVKNRGASKYTKSSLKKSTYSVTMDSKVDGRQVYCVVKDAYDKAVQTKTVALRQAVSIVTQPKTVTVANKKTAKVTVKAAGAGLTYTWYVKNSGASKYTKTSVRKNSYSVTMSSKVDGRSVYCLVKDKYGQSVKTKTVTLRMAASIVSQPKSVAVANKKTAKVTVKAAGSGLKYTWYVKDAGASKFTKSSVTKSTYSVKMSNKVNGRRVYCVVKDKYGNTVKTCTVKLTKK